MQAKINRILIPIIIVILCLGATLLSVGQAQVDSTYLPLISYNLSGWIGPDGGSIVSLLVDPSNAQVVYAGTWGSGVYKSLDEGQSWQAMSHGLTNLYISSLAINPVETSTLYAGTYHNQVYKSTDAGDTWIWSGTGMQDQAIVYTIAIDPENPSTIYAGTRGVSNNGNPPWNGVVYRSVDAGLTWIPVLSDIGGADIQDWVYSLAVNPNITHEVNAATHEHGPYHSSTYGDTWSPSHEGINDDSGRAIIISPEPTDSTTIFYGVWHFDTIYKTINGGDEWFLSNRNIQWTKVYSMALDLTHVETLYLATFSRGVLKTIDGGSTWQSAGLNYDLIYSIAINPISSSKLLAGTAGDGLYRSLDGGTIWQHSNNGIDNSMVTSVIISLSNPDVIYASIYGAGVVQSHNRGQTWTDLNTGLGDKFVHNLILDPAHPELLYALTDTGGLYQNNLNNGLGWVSYGQGLPSTLTPKPAYPANHPFATYEMQESFTVPQETSDENQPASVSQLVMTYAPSNPQIVYMGTGGSGVYKSTNGGATWQLAGLGGESILSLCVDYFDPNLVYAATGTSGSMKVSVNGGISWTNADLPVTFYSLAASPASSGSLYAGTSAGLYHFQSGSWTQIGLTDHEVTAIAADPNQANVLYAGTTSDAYYSFDGGLSWKPVDAKLHNLTVQSISIDPTRNNRVYFSTTTHGIYLATIYH